MLGAAIYDLLCVAPVDPSDVSVLYAAIREAIEEASGYTFPFVHDKFLLKKSCMAFSVEKGFPENALLFIKMIFQAFQL